MSLLHHKEAPTGAASYEQVNFDSPKLYDSTPLLPRLYQTAGLDEHRHTLSSRTAICGNDDVQVSFVTADEPSPRYRSAMSNLRARLLISKCLTMSCPGQASPQCAGSLRNVP